MSEVDLTRGANAPLVSLRLEWDETSGERLEGDHYQPRVEDEQGTVEQVEALVAEALVLYPEEFEWSQDRALAFERALGKLQGLTAAKLQDHLKALLAACREGDPVAERLDLTEAWLHDRLADWKAVSAVRHEDPERAEAFNQGLEAGANALSLAGEIVELLRAGELALVDRLLEQVGSYLLEARDQLLAAEPTELSEPEGA